MKSGWLCFLILIFSAGVSPASESAARIQEWLIPWESSRPRDPYVAPDGKVWFCGQAGNYIARLDPSSGDLERFDLGPGTYPHNLIVDSRGQIWYAGNRNAHIGRLDPQSGEITRYPMPNPAAGDPHTLTFDANGDIWFTVQWGNFIGKLATDSGRIQLVKVPTDGARPYGIKVDPTGHPWVALFGSHKLATLGPQSLRLREIPLPTTAARPRRLEITTDGSVWYADHARGTLGRYRPRVGDFKEWPLPGGPGARPYGTALDAQGRIWVAETGLNPNRLVAFDPASGRFGDPIEVPSGGGSIRHMHFHPPSGEIWFGTDSNRVGRLLPP